MFKDTLNGIYQSLTKYYEYQLQFCNNYSNTVYKIVYKLIMYASQTNNNQAKIMLMAFYKVIIDHLISYFNL